MSSSHFPQHLDQVLAWYVTGHARIQNLRPHIYSAGILTSERNLRWNWCSPFSVYRHQLGARCCNTDFSQAAKDVRASQDTLVDIFERIEMFFRRLEVYTEVSPTSEMMDIIIQIMVEVLSILGIATKEIKQNRISE
jgi:hypothetical protein